MAARPRTLPAAIAPVLVGTAAAIYEHGDLRRPWAFVAALVGSIFIQIGTNLANDYSDAKRGADTVDRLGPVRVTAAGLVAPRSVLIATWLAFGVAVAAGIYLATVAGLIIIAVGAASIAAGVLYTASYSSSSSSAWSPSTAPTTCSWSASTGCRSGCPSRWASSRRRSWSSTTCATSRRIAAPASGPWRSGWGARGPGGYTSR
jgi:hypothetical protein